MNQAQGRVKQIERYKIDIQLHAKSIAIGYNNYLCLNLISENGRQHNSPQSHVQLEATLNALFVSLCQTGCRQFHNDEVSVNVS